jgi:hypothetical protein
MGGCEEHIFHFVLAVLGLLKKDVRHFSNSEISVDI